MRPFRIRSVSADPFPSLGAQLAAPEELCSSAETLVYLRPKGEAALLGSGRPQRTWRVNRDRAPIPSCATR